MRDEYGANACRFQNLSHIFAYLRSVTLAELVQQQESRAKGEAVVMHDHRPASSRPTEPATA